MRNQVLEALGGDTGAVDRRGVDPQIGVKLWAVGGTACPFVGPLDFLRAAGSSLRTDLGSNAEACQ